jgi:transposase
MRVCIRLYEKAIDYYAQNILVLCTDQKTGIQALQRLFPDKPVVSGHIRKREYHYKRHGTKNLIAGFAVATGEVIGRCYDRNRNVEFCDFLTYTDDKFGTFEETHILADNYGTHTHMNTCLRVATLCGIEISEEELKKKKQRIEFLEREDKRIVFHFLPTHASWLNQIEIWFNILEKKAIRNGDFSDTDDLISKIMKYIELEWNPKAHPFQWTYKGKVCCA